MGQHKRIILCSDGTGNAGGKGNGTNVWKLFTAIDIHTDTTQQIAFHDDGVGSQDFIVFKLLGGAFGWGLSRNIRQLYKFLVVQYNPGDEIYLFGFSRGAHTVRILAEMICSFGILNRKWFTSTHDLEKAIKNLQREYKKGNRQAWRDALKGVCDSTTGEKRELTLSRLQNHVQKFESKLPALVSKGAVPAGRSEKSFTDVHIQFIGVWDTVDAIGVPIDELRESCFFAQHAFVDNVLNENVHRACQALSIDDARHTFHPVLWDQTSDEDRQRIEQVWFAGAHSNVGGGYAKDQIALVSLDWMMTKAYNNGDGVQFLPQLWEQYRNQANVHGKLYDSRRGFAAYYRYKPRNITWLTKNHGSENQEGTGSRFPCKIHKSVLDRLEQATECYAPFNIPENSEPVDHDRVVIDKERILNVEEMKSVTPEKKKYSRGYRSDILNTEIQQSITPARPTKEVLEAVGKEKRATDDPWNYVWWLRALHFFFVTLTAAFLWTGHRLTVSLHKPSHMDEGGCFKQLLGWIDQLAPDFLTSWWLPGYQQSPACLFTFIAFFILLFFIRTKLRQRVHHLGDLYWFQKGLTVHRVDIKPFDPGLLEAYFLSFAEKVRTNKLLNETILPCYLKFIVPVIGSLLILLIFLLLGYAIILCFRV